MFKKSFYHFLLLLLFTLIVTSSLQQQQQESFCIFQTNNGVFNLNKLKSTSYYSVSPSTGYQLLFNICSNVIGQTCQGKSYSSMVVFTSGTGSTKQCFTYIGGETKSSNYKISLLNSNNPEEGVKLTIIGGETIPQMTSDMKQQTTIDLICQPDNPPAEPILKYIGEEHPTSDITNYHVSITSSLACLSKDNPLSSTPLDPVGIGGLLLILFIFFFILYLIIGSILNKFYFNKMNSLDNNNSGNGGNNGFKEMIPNFNFWKITFQLFIEGLLFTKEGFIFLFNKITKRNQYAYSEESSLMN
ncbi:hypothetical protein ABK040_003911 [Willaertia magna]